MPKITFIEANGVEYHLECAIGESAMQAAVNGSVTGILADCGGSCTCATCHGYVDDKWLTQLPPANDTERDMIEFAPDVTSSSRLTCQIVMTPALDGIVIRLPKSQL